MIKITKTEYSDLKNLYMYDAEAIKYWFPIVVVSENTDNTVNILLEHEPSSYILGKQPWLLRVLSENKKLGNPNIHNNGLKPIEFIEQFKEGILNFNGISCYIGGIRMISARFEDDSYSLLLNGIIPHALYPLNGNDIVPLFTEFPNNVTDIMEVKSHLEKIINKYFKTFIL